jgi:hypothetical protein
MMAVDWLPENFNLLLAVGGVVFLGLSVLGTYYPNLVWGQPRTPPQSQADVDRLRRRRLIGTLVYFIVGAVLLVLSIR